MNNIVTPACAGGVCDGACVMGYADCDHDKLTNGCEVDIAGTDVTNCGGCGTTCSTANITAKCTGGVCDGTCAAGYADCNSNKQADGCETDINTSTTNCGACGTTCSASHMATVACGSGTCDGTCAAGYADCNNNKQSDGCETDIDTDLSACGACGHACAAGDACTNGVCTCLAGGKNPPPPCTAGTDGTTGSPWVVCTSSCSAAWLTSSNGATGGNSFHALTICNSLGYGAVYGFYQGTCGDTCSTCTAGTSCTAPGTSSFVTLAMPAGDVIGSTVEWECLP